MNYKCKMCDDIRTSRKAIIMHIRRAHKEVTDITENQHYKKTTKKIKEQVQKKKYAWQKWLKYPDGSRKFKLINDQWVKQTPGSYFLETGRKTKQKNDNLPKIVGFKEEPQIHSDGIVINMLIKIPLSFGLPVIIPNENAE